MDTLASLAIAVVIAYSSIRLLKDSINILMEGVPADVDIDKVKKAILDVPDVMAIHDLHVWMLSSGKNVLTAHVSVKGEIDRRKLSILLNEIETTIKENANIDHITIQIEPATFDVELDINFTNARLKRG
jgi:cobalt-zinc-cadmium efflux system protein